MYLLVLLLLFCTSIKIIIIIIIIITDYYYYYKWNRKRDKFIYNYLLLSTIQTLYWFLTRL